MVDHYQQELQSLNDELEGIETSGDDNSRLAHARKAKDQLKAQQNQRPQQPFDPNQLPNTMAVWRMIRRVDLPWQSTNKRSLKTVMFHNITWPA